jgi:RHS repeat-associated protein
MIDDLDYDYEGNQLRNVTDTSGALQGFNDGNKHMQTKKNDFEYDDYGNMFVDRNKGITNITYNHLNLPKKITFENNQSIEYIYGADGSKLRKKVTDGTKNKTVDYLDGFQYRNALLDFFPTAEGYVRGIPTDIGGGTSTYSFHYIFNYTDHLGNIRLKYTAHPQTGETQPLEENHYYPFGLKHQGYNPTHQVLEFDPIEGNVALITIPQNATDGYNYKFGGKELQKEFGIEMYDFGARMYMPDIGRWGTLDRKADAVGQIHNTPYGYAMNNPVVFTDPDGDCPPGVNCENVLANMERIRVNRASNLGAGYTRTGGTQWHGGHDLYAPVGTDVRSSMAGTVHATGTSASYGNYVTVKTTHTEDVPTGEYTTRADGTILPVTEEKTSTYYTFYAHLDTIGVEAGDAVTAGQNIGTSGTTGNAAGLTGDNEHLHFEIGTELRSAGSPFLKKSSLLDANTAYKDVKFTSQNPNARNQSDKGVIKTATDSNGNQTHTFQNFYNTTSNGTDQEWRIPMALPQQ